jgi:acetyl-CoA acetyltransferase
VNAVIIGAAETDRVGVIPELSTMGLHLQAATNALADAGLTPADIDGVASIGTPGPVTIAHALGIKPLWLDGTYAGGASFLIHVRHAAAAIAAGYCHTVLITHGESGRSRVGPVPLVVEPWSVQGQFEVPYGIAGAATTFTVPALRYMKETGTTHEQLAQVAVVTRQWAHLNPRALRRDPITVDDVLASRMIAYPFHQLECCLVTDGGGALIMTSAERAQDLPQRAPRVHLLGSGESSDGPVMSMMADLTRSRGFQLSSQAAFRHAGIRPSDVDHVMIYDAFAHVPLFGLEDMGFVGRGEAASFIEDGHTRPGGSLPMNTNGGGLSYTHTGMYGMFAILESVRQLRGQAAAQVPDPKISAVLGNGGSFVVAGTLILGTAEAADY